MAILRGFLGSKGRFVGVLGLPPQKEMPIIQYKALGTVTGSTSVGKTWSTPLANTGLTLEVLPTASGGGTVTAVVCLLRGGAAAMTSTLRIATGGQVLTGGLRFPPVVSSSSSAPGRLLFV